MISQLGDRMDVVLVARALLLDVDDEPVRDAYGNDVYEDTETGVPGCAVQPRNTSEDVSGRDQVFSELILHCPLGTAVGAADAVKVAGVSYEVLGDPRVWNGFGDDGYIEVALQRVTG